MTTTPPLPEAYREARRRLQGSAASFVETAAATLKARRSKLRDEDLPRVGDVLRAADVVLEALDACPDEEATCASDIRALAGALRHLAFFVLAAHTPDQAWFWTPEWQAGERQADADKAAGRFTRYYSDAEFFAALRAERPDVADLR